MTKVKTLKEYQGQIQECVKCGACQAHCPVYLEDRHEGGVARGKLALAHAVLSGETGLEKRLQEDISLCLMCGSCVTKCPNKVPTDEIVGALRRDITENKGLSLVGKAVHTVTGSQPLMTGLAKGGALLTQALFKKVPDASGLRLRFPLPVMKDRTLPKVAKKNLFERFPEYIEGDPGKPCIGIFSGCSTTYLYPEVGESMIRVLTELGFSIYLPKDQGCCGIPALSSGDGALIEKLADTNLKAFKGKKVDHIVTACASCFGGIGHHYESLGAEFIQFTGQVTDIHVFLKQQGVVDRLKKIPKWKQRTTVTYHDPCHLKTKGITKEPRDLLRAMPNIDFKEMENSSLCCGLGGTFSVYHYDLSKKIGSRKITGLKECGASQVATSCPGCIMQLQDTINHGKLQIEAVHLLDLLYQGLKND